MAQQLAALGHSPSDEDQAFVRGLRPAQIQVLVNRLIALVALKNGATTKQASQVADISVPSMFRLKKVWKEQPALKAIAGPSARRGRGGERADKFERARGLAERRLKSGAPPESLNAFAEEIVRASGDVSKRAAERIARDALKAHRLSADDLASAFGRDIIVDAVGVSIILDLSVDFRREERRQEVGVMAIVLDQASGLVLAAIVDESRAAVGTQYAALNWAYEDVQALDMDARGSEPSRLHVTLGPVRLEEERRFARDLKAIPDLDLIMDGPRRFGKKAMQVLGRSIGPIQMIPGATETGRSKAAVARASGKEAVSVFRANEMVQAAISAHNDPILKKLKSVGALGANTESGIGPIGMSLSEVLAHASISPLRYYLGT